MEFFHIDCMIKRGIRILMCEHKQSNGGIQLTK